MEKGWRKRIDDVKNRITDGHNRGVCDSSGRTVKVNGRPVAMPRKMGYAKVKCYKCNQWYRRGEPCGC